MGAPHWICYELETMNATPSDKNVNHMEAVASRAAAHPLMQQAILSAVTAALPQVIESVMKDLYGGQRMRVYVQKGRTVRSNRHQQIERLLDLGLSAPVIAAQIGCSERTVYRVASRR